VIEEKDFSKTLSLPKTGFHMKANFSQRGCEFVEEWDKEQLYIKLCEKNKNKKKFILHDGPPYANAHIHIGTGLNKVLKDFVVKFRSMFGNYVPFNPGWDCHGLPIELVVLKEMKTDKNKVDKLVFRKQAANFVKKFIEIQKNEFKKLGVVADWKHPYLTLDHKYESSIVKIFVDLVKKGYVYRKKKPVYWCPTCETALADAEVEYVNHSSDSIFVKFRVVSFPKVFKTNGIELKDFSVLAWTTNPWTLPANMAVAFNGHSDYVAVVYKFENFREEKLIIAKALAENIKNRIKAINFETIFEAKGADFVGIKCENPLFLNKQSQGVIADFVSIKDGTGIVHIAPGHGQEDYQVGLEYGFEIISFVNGKGLYTKEVLGFENVHIFEANSLIINKLKEEGKILANLKLNHSYPHCWRCRKPIIFRATPQWFLSLECRDLRKRMLQLIKNINWIPSYGENRITSMLKSRPDWCLSRQRLWGVPIPVFYCINCDEPLLDIKIMDRISTLFNERGSDSWFEMTEKELLNGINAKCSLCNSVDFRKEHDIFDVWFDSGASYEAVLSSGNYKDLEFPADLYLEGSDQHRGWFQTSFILSLATKEKVPYKSVLTHGFVVDGHGKKMSKSLGNFMLSDQLINKYGADIIRFWIASSDYKEDIKISDDIVKGLSDVYRKIRNTIRFLLGNLWDFDTKKSLFFKDMCEIDKYALSRLQQLISCVIDNYKSYEFHKVTKVINNFCTVFLSGFYLGALKDTLYCDRKDSKERLSAQSAMFEICSVIIKLISPILSFTAEEAWREMKNLQTKSCGQQQRLSSSIFLTDFPLVDKNYILQSKVFEKWEKIFDIRKKVLSSCESLRQNKIIGSISEASLIIMCGQKYSDLFEDLRTLNLALGSYDISYSFLEKKDGVIHIEASKSNYEKCMRCWRHIDNIKDGLCLRCRGAINYR
jgi:isoleucyl-tRNA synthetase